MCAESLLLNGDTQMEVDVSLDLSDGWGVFRKERETEGGPDINNGMFNTDPNKSFITTAFVVGIVITVAVVVVVVVVGGGVARRTNKVVLQVAIGQEPFRDIGEFVITWRFRGDGDRRTHTIMGTSKAVAKGVVSGNLLEDGHQNT